MLDPKNLAILESLKTPPIADAEPKKIVPAVPEPISEPIVPVKVTSFAQ